MIIFDEKITFITILITLIFYYLFLSLNINLVNRK
jgi:hypothetical protein